MPFHLQVGELLDGLLSINLLLEGGHCGALQAGEHRVERRGQHVAAAGAADDTAGGRQRRCLGVAHAVVRLVVTELVRIQHDRRPVELLVHTHR